MQYDDPEVDAILDAEVEDDDATHCIECMVELLPHERYFGICEDCAEAHDTEEDDA